MELIIIYETFERKRQHFVMARVLANHPDIINDILLLKKHNFFLTIAIIATIFSVLKL